MTRSLARKGYPEEEIAVAVERLRSWKYVGDAALAERVAGKSASLRRGRRSAARELAVRGVDAEVAQAAIATQYAGRDDELLEQALEQALRAMGGVRSRKEAARLARRLISRGFDPGAVFARLRRADLLDGEAE